MTSFHGATYVVVPLWMAVHGGNELAVSQISVGVFVWLSWNALAHKMGWSLLSDLHEGTLELTMLSRTPVWLSIWARSLAFGTFGPAVGVITFLVVVAAMQQPLTITSPANVAISVVVVVGALIAVGYISAPLTILAGVRTGYFEIVPTLVMTCSGFIYPISILPPFMQTIAQFLPTSWAMQALVDSVNGSATPLAIARSWLFASVEVVVYLGLSYLMIRIVEVRLRRNAALAGV